MTFEQALDAGIAALEKTGNRVKNIIDDEGMGYAIIYSARRITNWSTGSPRNTGPSAISYTVCKLTDGRWIVRDDAGKIIAE